VNAHDGLAERRLATAALADQTECFAGPHRERDAVDGADPAGAPAEGVAHRKMPGEIDQLEQRRARDAHALAPSAG
jgi:hypothetical protein